MTDGIGNVTANLLEQHGAPDESLAPEDRDLDRQSFLKLLTTQLQHQDPMDPMSNEEFVAQLATFSSLEQLLEVNQRLDAVYMGVAGMNSSSMASLLGTEVIAQGNEVAYDGEGSLTFRYDAAQATQTTTLTVQDDSGRVIHSVELGPVEIGEGVYEWDGRDLSGQPVPEGHYTFQVVGTDVEGDTVQIQERVQGIVTEMDYSGGSPLPSINGVVVELGDILRLTSGDDQG